MDKIYLAEIKVGNRKRPADPEKVQVIAASMHENGQHTPIGLDPDGNLIFGFHRYCAAKQLGWKEIGYTTLTLDGKLRYELAEIDENLVRAELKELQRIQQLARREDIMNQLGKRAKSGDNQRKPKSGGEKIAGATTDDLAADAGLSTRSYQQKMQVAKNLDPQVADAIAETPIADSATQLMQLARLSPEDQRLAQELVQNKDARDFKDAIRQIRRLHMQDIPLPQGQFNLISPDMPWQYENDGVRGAAENHYPTMSLEEMLDQPIGALFAKQSVLFLWVTKDHMREAFQLIDAWGLVFKFEFIWEKPSFGTGSYGRNKHEKLWLCTRGDDMTPAWMPEEGSILRWPRAEHSRKPVEAYQMMERMYPHLDKRLELYGRSPREGWTIYGNEVGKFEAQPQPEPELVLA